MRVMGVDPGLTRCGLGVIESHAGRRVSLVGYRVARSPADAPLDERILAIATVLDDWLERHRPDVVAVESVFAQHNQMTVIGTAQISGVAMLLAARRGVPVASHTPSEVKAAVTGSGRAEKLQVQRMVGKLLGLEELPKPADAADALALAICHAWRPAGVLAGPGERAGLTPAQRRWAEAERAARRG